MYANERGKNYKKINKIIYFSINLLYRKQETDKMKQ